MKATYHPKLPGGLASDGMGVLAAVFQASSLAFPQLYAFNHHLYII
jgi:hypothetical protein